MTDPYLCAHCGSRRGMELVKAQNMPDHLEQRRCLDCGKSTVYAKPSPT